MLRDDDDLKYGGIVGEFADCGYRKITVENRY
jgi:hypothetical protein